MAKSGRRRQDHLARKAQRDGYGARSVYKLEEIDRRHRVLPAGGVILDVGAAPGSWSQYARERGCRVVAIDLNPFEVDGVEMILGDATDEAVIADLASRGPYRLVMSDAAPATTGNRVVDTGRSEAIVESIIASLPRWLDLGGSFVAKLFQGGGEQRLLADLRHGFDGAWLVRPGAVRSESFETYLVAKGYRGGAAPG